MIREIRNQSKLKDFDLINLVQRRLGGQLIEVFRYLHGFTTVSARKHFDYHLNDRTINKEVKLLLKHSNTTVSQHFYPIKMTKNLESSTK